MTAAARDASTDTAAGVVGAWLGAAAPAARLAIFRVLVGAFATIYVAVRAPVFFGLVDRPTSSFEPVGVLWWLGSPLPDQVVVLGVIGLLAFGFAFTVGALHRVTGPLFAILVLLVTTYRSSWGQLLWFENLMVLHLLIVGFSRAADAASVDARRRHDAAAPIAPIAPSSVYGWPLRMAAIVTVLTYVLAGVAKLRIGGLAWLDGDTLRHHVAYSATRLDVLGGTPSPLAAPFVRQGWLSSPLAVATLVIELGAPVALLGGRWRNTWVGAAWSLHLGIALVMFVVFPYPLLLVAFAPMFALERLARRPLIRRRRVPA